MTIRGHFHASSALRHLPVAARTGEGKTSSKRCPTKDICLSWNDKWNVHWPASVKIYVPQGSLLLSEAHSWTFQGSQTGVAEPHYIRLGHKIKVITAAPLFYSSYYFLLLFHAEHRQCVTVCCFSFQTCSTYIFKMLISTHIQPNLQPGRTEKYFGAYLSSS